MKAKRLYHDREWLRQEYIVKRRTLRDIGHQCGVSGEAVRLAVERLWLYKPLLWQTIDENWLRQEYVEKRRRQVDLATELKVSESAIRRAVKKYGIVRPSFTPEERRQRYNERQNRRYAADSEHRRKKNICTKRWREDNPDRQKEYQRRWRTANREKINIQQREYRRRKKRAIDV